MYTATVSPTANATSLRDLVNTALAAEIPTPSFTGRCYQVTLIGLTGSPVISSRGNFIPPAPPPANNGVVIPVNVPIVFQSPTGNQISIDEIYLSSAAASTVGVMILIL